MNFKKRVNGSWVDTPHYIHKTDTDTITTLPTVIYPTDTTATVGLKGQTLQSSIPSPTSPVIPQGTGERTGNLFDKDNATIYSLYPGTGNTIKTSSNARSIAIPCEGGEIYTVSKKPGERFIVCFTTEPITSQVAYTDAVIDNRAASITVAAPSNAKFLFVYFYNSMADVDTAETMVNSIMINTGSTPLPYEPYGYKIPISSANTTTPIYLGEVESTRRIRKLVFDGSESWNRSTSGNNTRVYTPQIPECMSLSPAICTHFDYNVTNVGYPRIGEFVINSSKAIIFGVDGNTFADVNAWKAYLAQQYANGTPVTVWYVLATEETGIVNEPLMKIGDYADEVSGITIPTMAGANTIDIDTTLKPSEVTVNYHGWHPVQSVHERESNYTIATMQAFTIAQLQTHTISELQGGEWS